MAPNLTLGTVGSAYTPPVDPLYSWGESEDGRLGNGTVSPDVTSPAQVGSDTDWDAVAAGQYHSLGLKDGKLYAWGKNDAGQLGDGTTTNRSSPVQIGTGTDWTAIGAGFSYSHGVKGGKLYSWGQNALYYLGDGTTTQRNSPHQIGSDTDWESVTASRAIKTNGKLYSWGPNFFNGSPVGDGTELDRPDPVQIGSDTDWKIVAAYENIPSMTFAIKTNGKMYSWGSNANYQTGLNTNSGNTLNPTQIGTDTDWAAVAAGGSFGIAVKTNGKAYSWGVRANGRLGDGNTTGNTTTPTQIGTDTDWAMPSAGLQFAAATKTNGKLYGWGANASGQIGDGTTTQRTSPVQVGSGEDWTVISCGDIHSLGIR